jgi:hypothetical protein
VRVVENGERTEVAVTDENDAPVTQGPGLSLLNLLFEAIKTDAEGKPKSGDKETQKTGAEEPQKSGDNQQRSSGEKEKPPTDGGKQQQ